MFQVCINRPFVIGRISIVRYFVVCIFCIQFIHHRSIGKWIFHMRPCVIETRFQLNSSHYTPINCTGVASKLDLLHMFVSTYTCVDSILFSFSSHSRSVGEIKTYFSIKLNHFECNFTCINNLLSERQSSE